MIVVSLHSQMGNQMFQYAFAVSNAKSLKTLFFTYLCSPNNPFKLEYFKLDFFTRFVYSKKWITKQYKRICRIIIGNNRGVVGDNDGWLLLEDVKNNFYYSGYFQSEAYFKAHFNIVKKAFSIKNKYKKLFKEKYGDLFKENKVVVVHVRRTDYNDVNIKGLGSQGVALPLNYYRQALLMINNIGRYKLLFISDDIESVKKDFSDIPGAFFESNVSIVDFQLIQNADVAIISNSTFAWWAAFLSTKENIVMAPKNWLGFKVNKTFPVGIETNKFEWIDF